MQLLITLFYVLHTYVKALPMISGMSLLNKTSIDDDIGLRVIRGTNRGKLFSLKKDGQINGQAAYSFLMGVPLWIVDENQSELRGRTSAHVDLWEEENALCLPQDRSNKRKSVKTIIIIPIIRELEREGEREKETVGVVEFESKHYWEPTEIAMEELSKIADTLSRVQYLYRTFGAQKHNTKEAIKRLKHHLESREWPPLTQPKIFVAFSGKADQQVIEKIRTVLKEFSHKIKPVFWDRISTSGKVDEQIIRAIRLSQYGICYFSEPVSGLQGNFLGYRDNHNVLFEAGMFQALTNSPNDRPVGWIPIREKRSPPVPFDFASDRIVEVARVEENRELDVKRFGEALKRRIESLIEPSSGGNE